MTRTGTTQASLRRALRREVPSTVGLLADEHDFTTMRQYRTFVFDDHPTYVRQVEALLKTLARQGGHTTVTLFDPEEYAAYCAETAIDPDHPASRSRFTAHLAVTGARIAYTGQPFADLLTDLVDTAVRHATWEYATTVLATTGDCATCGKDIGKAAFERATTLLTRLLDAAGPGTHHLVCSVPAADDQLLAALQADGSTRPASVAEEPATEFTAVLAAGIALGARGGLVLRTLTPGAPDRLHGWRLTDGSLVPLTEAEVFAAYCTDNRTGEPLPPEPGVEHRAGFPLPTDPDDDWPAHH
ncbi:MULTISPECIES: hypothetical protein [unclassified Streptomyces]|uniref:hypothetical protein n=1 Tax=unclassified Streptomyces TaxID=2593676 RepID=UPI0016613984|nr:MULTISPECIES: hypothetical protein [unclassified Streptomyces]MBD0709749.1 hypothetical protein [Streptomyces sp. CBMA291]MBD0717520.1 hypothetical protein [Streptomyces sp. CBMA370]